MSANSETPQRFHTSHGSSSVPAQLNIAARVCATVGLTYWVVSVLVSWFSPMAIEWSLKQVGAARAGARLVNFVATQVQGLAHPLIAGLLFAVAIACALLARRLG